jgi:hypothetical protein
VRRSTSPAGLVRLGTLAASAALAAGVACGRSQGVPDEQLGELVIDH